MTEEEKMLAGKLYDPSDPKLDTRRLLAHRLSMEYNNTLETDAEKRKAILAQLLPDCGEDTFLQGRLLYPLRQTLLRQLQPGRSGRVSGDFRR